MPACCSSSKRSMVGSEMLRGKGMLPWKRSKNGQVCPEVCHQRGQVDNRARHHQVQGHQRVIKVVANRANQDTFLLCHLL